MDSSQSAATAGTGGGGNGMTTSQSSAMVATTVVDDPKKNLNQVTNSIQKVLGLLHQLYLTVSSFNAASQLPLLQCLNSLVLELDNMVKLAEKCNIQVPMEVLNLIDDGKNPDEFTRDVINSCIAKNQITKGKTDAFKGLHRHLLEELEQAFPDEVESYREIRAASAAELKHLAQAQTTLPNGDVKIKSEL
ncbi:mediator of RNA polymerase II transcription subunit 10b-like [Juglans microcarpa x Juglans regia]|uniref:mediator of RNA polymerase II transcription subunit 10b-like n=1 Tax=Juglans microcarpa x Juglans regia TaxID=2249226 RepID=UPI001B7EA65F|nr:mediator of RNA polymerase II transcription subunit 10b-like [Juglans microcarpa x Juglans regia]XP_040990634.1 mediator of RNA polymerase II transcription subunit 10b-like [Juglans microcarpa x Juglans regia]XP_040990635.1 mediator of RNA polymerase II transcription subunit 10b-like [Juglans microcarpa x Juglans regia]XP_040990637.1 mediator of RNA polymerase II transcription subunit 10b-like [Juglans microcarpa x Juglans regia]XP_040990638.1 mediator of RNA polymerase II transcription subu